MTIFTGSDVESLEAKLLALELSDEERVALDALVACAEQGSTEVSGFTASAGLKLGGLQFLTTLDTRPDGLLPDGGTFATAGGLGTTRIKESDDALGDN